MVEMEYISAIIVVNVAYVNDYSVLETVAHELYHAYQEDVVTWAIPHREPATVVYAWRQNFSNYYTPGSVVNGYTWGYTDYYNQAVEIGAFWFSGGLDDRYYVGAWYGYYGK